MMFFWKVLGVGLVALALGCEGDAALRSDPAQTGWVDVTLAGKPTVLWTAELGAEATGPALLGRHVYVATDGAVRALSRENGVEVWRSEVAGVTTGVAGFGEWLVVGTGSGQVVALTTEGEPGWRAELGAAVWDSPVGADELLVSTAAGEVVALGADGQERWRAQTAGPLVSRVAVEGPFVAVASGDGHVYAFDRARQVLVWQWAGAGPMSRGVTLGAEDVVFAADEALRSLNRKDGTLRWSFPVAKGLNGRAVVSASQVFGLDDAGNLVAVDRKTGKKSWEVQVEPSWGALVGAGNHLVVTQPDGVIGLDAATGEGLWEAELPGTPRWTPALDDGRVYVAVGSSLVALAFQP